MFTLFRLLAQQATTKAIKQEKEPTVKTLRCLDVEKPCRLRQFGREACNFHIPRLKRVLLYKKLSVKHVL